MKVDQEVKLILAFIVVTFLGLFILMSYDIHEKSKCKKLAIEHNMPYLEIKELCK